MGFYKKLGQRRTLNKIFLERLTEPLHLNFLSAFVWLFGSFRQRVAFDLILRRQHAFGLLSAAEQAGAAGIKSVTAVEFGVAAGTGLMNMCHIAAQVTRVTGVDIKVCGFDTGRGMPKAKDYRDHPELYQEGDFPMDESALRARLPPNGSLVIGRLAETVPAFLQHEINPENPLGYAVIDVDYYSSTVDALKIFNGPPALYLPETILYLDDVMFRQHNAYAGELLAINEFSREHEYRKICKHEFLENWRVFRRANWIKHIYFLQVMDHPSRNNVDAKGQTRVLENLFM